MVSMSLRCLERAQAGKQHPVTAIHSDVAVVFMVRGTRPVPPMQLPLEVVAKVELWASLQTASVVISLGKY